MDLSFIQDDQSRAYVEDACAAVTLTESWALLAQDVGDRGVPVHKAVLDKMVYRQDHSGSSYQWTMLQIQWIARHGLEAYRALWALPRQP